MIEIATFDSLGTRRTEAVPELRDRYEAMMRERNDEASGPHVVLGDVLNP